MEINSYSNRELTCKCPGIHIVIHARMQNIVYIKPNITNVCMTH